MYRSNCISRVGVCNAARSARSVLRPGYGWLEGNEERIGGGWMGGRVGKNGPTKLRQVQRSRLSKCSTAQHSAADSPRMKSLSSCVMAVVAFRSTTDHEYCRPVFRPVVCVSVFQVTELDPFRRTYPTAKRRAVLLRKRRFDVLLPINSCIGELAEFQRGHRMLMGSLCARRRRSAREGMLGTF